MNLYFFQGRNSTRTRKSAFLGRLSAPRARTYGVSEGPEAMHGGNHISAQQKTMPPTAGC